MHIQRNWDPLETSCIVAIYKTSEIESDFFCCKFIPGALSLFGWFALGSHPVLLWLLLAMCSGFTGGTQETLYGSRDSRV